MDPTLLRWLCARCRVPVCMSPHAAGWCRDQRCPGTEQQHCAHHGACVQVLFDTKSKSQPSAMGGTGEVFDWKLAADVAATYPFFLAGGLRPDNVVEAVSLVKPFALDVSSGVEASAGVKCVDKVQAFIKAVKSL
eukprot:m.1558318 g.1558318  ORF g.1558318 m.1558318 type:complete len:135 (+) comp25273_c0_seq58:6495-6899(+)